MLKYSMPKAKEKIKTKQQQNPQKMVKWKEIPKKQDERERNANGQTHPER